MHCVICSMRFERWCPADTTPTNVAIVRWRRAGGIVSNCVPTADDSLPPGGQTLRQAFEALVTTLNERGIRYAIIGGLAFIQHARVRTTDDIDVLLTIPRVAIPEFFEALMRRGFIIELQKTIQEFCEGGLTTIEYADVIVDLMQPVLPAYTRVLDRVICADILGHRVKFSSAEGLVVMKLISMRPQDETDVQDVLAAYGDNLDLDFIRAELETFTELGDARRAKFETWVEKWVGNKLLDEDGQVMG